MCNENNDTIYYYTSNEVLLKWYNKRKIWATRSVMSNDSIDTHYLVDVFSQCNPEILAQGIINNAKRILEYRNTISLNTLKDILYVSYNLNNGFNNTPKDFQSLIKVLPNEVLKSINGLANISEEICKDKLISAIYSRYHFVICFTYAKDERFFWDSYTNNYGICLEFSRKELKEWISSKYANNYVFGNIRYDKFEQKEYVENLTGKILDFSDEFISEFITQIGCLTKHPYWKSENECRIGILASYVENANNLEIKENHNMKYKSDYVSQDYIEIDIPKHFVKSITIGPHNSKKNISEKCSILYGDMTIYNQIISDYRGRVYNSEGTNCLRQKK